jgi:hypothetical protein
MRHYAAGQFGEENTLEPAENEIPSLLIIQEILIRNL